jgi:hypothetical protein
MSLLFKGNRRVSKNEEKTEGSSKMSRKQKGHKK